MKVRFLDVCEPKLIKILEEYRGPLVVSYTVFRLPISENLPLSLEIVEKLQK